MPIFKIQHNIIQDNITDNCLIIDINADSNTTSTLQFKLLRAKVMVSPNILFEELIEHCRNINKLYIDHHIKDNIENQEMFQPMLNDLVFGMKKIGLFPVDKV